MTGLRLSTRMVNPAVLAALTDLPAVRKQVNFVAGRIRNDARRNAPKRTGDLRRSIRVVNDRELDALGHRRRVYYVTVGMFYGRFVEFGTFDHSPRPFLRPAADRYR